MYEYVVMREEKLWHKNYDLNPQTYSPFPICRI